MFKPLLITVLALAVVAAAVFVGGKYLKKEAADETAGWQTYRNEKYGFEFRYPNDLNEERFSIETEIKEKTSSDLWAQSILQFTEGTELFVEEKTINQKPVIFYYGHPPVTGITKSQKLLTLMFYDEKSGREVSVAFSGFSQDRYEQDIQTIQKIASTFKFIQ